MADKRFKKILWEDPETKQRLRCREITDTGSREIIIDKADEDNWNAALAETSIDEITARTQADIDEFRTMRDTEEQHQQEHEKRAFAEQLFQAKLTLYELPEIKASTNKKLKRRLRKAETFEALNVYASAVVSDYDNSQ
jgi:hypothetical protein|tara:strand:+ start:1188 stop:1604 length:417 start_codon:yes stop_codon:yes gene_type:complete